MSTFVLCIAETAARAAGMLIRLRASGVPDGGLSVVCVDRTADGASGPDPGPTLRAALAGVGAIESAAFADVGRVAVCGPLTRPVVEHARRGDSVVRVFTAMAVPSVQGKRFELALKRGAVIMAACAENAEQLRKIAEIFESHRARNIATARDAGGSDSPPEPVVAG